MLCIYLKKIYESTFFQNTISTACNWFFRNQIIFIEPSFIIIGNDQFLINLKDFEKKNDKRVETISFLENEKEAYDWNHCDIQRCCYKIVDKNSF